MKKQLIAIVLLFTPAFAFAVNAPEYKDIDANGDGVLNGQDSP